MTDVYRDLFEESRTRRFVLTGFLGRLPMSMLGIGTIMLVSTSTGSFALAGAVSATMLLSQCVTAPQIGRWSDRLGQRRVLLPVIALHAAGLLAIVVFSLTGAPIWTLFLAGVAVGGTFPPIGSLVRARWGALLGGTDRLPAAFSIEAAIDEVVYILGPLLVVALIWLWEPAAGLLAALVLTICGGLAFAAQRDSEPPVGADHRVSRSVLRHGGMRVLTATCVAMATVIGATEVALVAFASEQGRPLAAGPLIALFSVGSVVAGLFYGSRTWRAPLPRRFIVATAVLLLSTVPIALSAGLWVMTISVLVAGFAFSPTLIIGYELADAMAGDAMTEGFAWLQTSLGAGLAVGAALAGPTIEAAGARTAFLLPVAAGLVALGLTVGGRAALTVDLDGSAQSPVASL